MKDINQEEWRELTANDQQAEILDVRTPEEHEEGYIANSKLVDIQQPQVFVSEVEKLDKSKNYYIYCRSGGRSSQACQILEQMGFENTFNLIGGFSKWEGEKQTS